MLHRVTVSGPEPRPHLDVVTDVQDAGWPILGSIESASGRLDVLEATFLSALDRRVELRAIASLLARFGDAWVLGVRPSSDSRIETHRGLWDWPDCSWATGGTQWPVEVGGSGVAGLVQVPSDRLEDALASCVDAPSMALLLGTATEPVAARLVQEALVSWSFDVGLLALHAAAAGLLTGRLAVDGGTDQLALQLFAPAGHPLLL